MQFCNGHDMFFNFFVVSVGWGFWYSANYYWRPLVWGLLQETRLSVFPVLFTLNCAIKSAMGFTCSPRLLLVLILKSRHYFGGSLLRTEVKVGKAGWLHSATLFWERVLTFHSLGEDQKSITTFCLCCILLFAWMNNFYLSKKKI